MTFPFDPDLVQRLGTAALHFLWQGAILGLFAFLAARSIPSASRRYAVLYAALVAMAICPLLTILLTSGQPASGVSGFVAASTAADVGLWSGLIWLVGVLVGSVRLAGGWAYLQWQLRRSASAPTRQVRESLARMSERIGVGRMVDLVVSPRVENPSTAGWLRAVIYLPAATVARLSTDQIDAILAHELAHIRRHDYLLNLIQRGIETLLFYHPAMWWISNRIRVEREHCCDDEAIAALGCPARYAEALLQLEVGRPRMALVLAATDGDLLSRLKRIGRRDEYRPTRQASTVWSAIFAFCLLASLGMSARPQTHAPAPKPLEHKIEENRIVVFSMEGKAPNPVPADQLVFVPMLPAPHRASTGKTIRIERRVSSSSSSGHMQTIVMTAVENDGQIQVSSSSSSSASSSAAAAAMSSSNPFD